MVRLIAGKWGGGRGILTALGAVVTISPVVALIAFLAGVVVLVLTRYMAGGAIAGAVGAIVTLVVLGATGGCRPGWFPELSCACSWCSVFTTTLNDLLKGTEPKLGT